MLQVQPTFAHQVTALEDWNLSWLEPMSFGSKHSRNKHRVTQHLHRTLCRLFFVFFFRHEQHPRGCLCDPKNDLMSIS